MLLDSAGNPYSEAELAPQRRTPCAACGSTASRHVFNGFAKHWRLSCQQCGNVLAQGRGELPEGEA